MQTERAHATARTGETITPVRSLRRVRGSRSLSVATSYPQKMASPPATPNPIPINHSYPYVRLQMKAPQMATHDATIGSNLRQVPLIPDGASQETRSEEIGSEEFASPVLKIRNFGPVIGGTYFAPCMTESEPATYDMLKEKYSPAAETATSSTRRPSNDVRVMDSHKRMRPDVIHPLHQMVGPSNPQRTESSHRRNVLTKTPPTRHLLRQKRFCIFPRKKSKRPIVPRPMSPRMTLDRPDGLACHPPRSRTPSPPRTTGMALERENATLKEEVAALRRDRVYAAHYRWLYEVEQRKVDELRQKQVTQSQGVEQGSAERHLEDSSASAAAAGSNAEHGTHHQDQDS
jgi:hypothetical protein